MEHRNGAHKHPIDARKLPNATQKLPDDTCMRLIAPHTPCNCAAMHLNQTCASRNIWSAVCNKTTLPKKIQWARRNTRSVKN